MTAHQKAGFTLLELVVAVGIVFLLASLLLVGVQSARETSRRVTCLNHLKQIGLGLQNYHSTHRCFPAGAAPSNALSPLVAILPYVGEQQLYATIDFSANDFERLGPLTSARVGLYRCPSTSAQERNRTDYALNRGTTLSQTRNDPWFFFERRFPRLEAYSRGSSATALIAEICPYVDGMQRGALHVLSERGIQSESDSDVFVNECRERGRSMPVEEYGENGFPWFGTGTQNYYHIMPPNSYSCGNGNLTQYSLNTSESMHSGGVLCLFADSHVEFMSQSISTSTWKQLGNR